jgi:Zn-dependent protease with chaperone function
VDLGVLLTLPVESIAIRAIIATGAATLLVRALLRSGLRAPAVRVSTALAPAAAIAGVVLLTWSSLHLPAVMLPVEGSGALPIPVQDGYLHFAPVAIPLLVGGWAAVAGVRLLRRGARSRRACRRAELALREGGRAPELEAMAARLAEDLRVSAPAVTVLPSCRGGALVVGSRRPVVILGRDLLERLDEAELEGVLAHELAHVRRCDNLVASLLGAVRDLTFFVPFGGWAIRQLHRERELAADQVAVAATGRPGALASGLLKVLEVASPDAAHPCATLAPGGGLVERVRVLVEDQPRLSPTRRSSEVVAVSSAVVTAIVVALVLPSVLAGPERERDAVAFLWSTTAATPASEATVVVTGEARAFDVYRRSSLEAVPRNLLLPAQLDEHSLENRRSTLRACGTEGAACPDPEPRIGLGLRPRPTITVDDALTSRWQAATPVVAGSSSGDGFRVYWLQRAAEAEEDSRSSRSVPPHE